MWASSTGTTAARASANSTTARLPLPSRVAWATRPSWSTTAASSSGTRWPSVVTHSDEMASKYRLPWTSMSSRPSARSTVTGRVARVGGHLGEPVPDHGDVPGHPGIAGGTGWGSRRSSAPSLAHRGPRRTAAGPAGAGRPVRGRGAGGSRPVEWTDGSHRRRRHHVRPLRHGGGGPRRAGRLPGLRHHLRGGPAHRARVQGPRAWPASA